MQYNSRSDFFVMLSIGVRFFLFGETNAIFSGCCGSTVLGVILRLRSVNMPPFVERSDSGGQIVSIFDFYDFRLQ